MTIELEFPPEFGGAWEQFCHDWCCAEGSLAYSREDIGLALAPSRGCGLQKSNDSVSHAI